MIQLEPTLRVTGRQPHLLWAPRQEDTGAHLRPGRQLPGDTRQYRPVQAAVRLTRTSWLLGELSVQPGLFSQPHSAPREVETVRVPAKGVRVEKQKQDQEQEQQLREQDPMQKSMVE